NQAVQALTLTPDKSAGGKAAVHTLSLANNAKIPQLTDGQNYYVVNRDALTGKFQLSTTDPASATNGVLLTSGGMTGGPHVLSLEGVDLKAAGSGEQRLVIDLTATGSGTQRLIGAGGAGFINPSSGDGVTTASATGRSGGGITVQGGHAT